MGFIRHSHVQKLDSASPMSWFACAVIYSTHAMSPAPAPCAHPPLDIFITISPKDPVGGYRVWNIDSLT